MPRSWSRIGGWRLKYEQIPIVKRPNDVLNRVLVILMGVFSQNEYNFLRTIASNNSLPFNFDIYYGDGNLLDLLKTNYDRGYRIFISTHGSFALKPIFEWLNSRPDVLVINTPSTLSVQNYSALLGVDVLPYNLIRTAIPDDEMILTLFKDILFKLPNILKTSEQNELYEPLQNIPSHVFPFNNIVYIHLKSGYTDGYLQTLVETINTLNLNVELTNLEMTPDTSGNYILSNEAVYYLIYNNIKNAQYVNSNNKPLIILNCEPDMKNVLMNLLKDERYYNNYTLLSDSFATVFDISYNFTAALMPLGNFSRRGYVLSSIVDSTQSISPFILNIFEIFANCGGFFKNLLNNNFRASNIIDQFINIKIMKINSWSDKNLIVSKIQKTSDILTNTSWKWEILLKKQNYNFEEISIISSSDQVMAYPDNLVFGNEYGNVNNFETNLFLTNLASTGSSINAILENKYILVFIEQYLIDYKNFLIQNFTKKMPQIMFNHYMLFINENRYNISIQFLQPITIDVIIGIEEFVNNNTINIHIPEIVYNVNEYFYDTSNNRYVDEYTREFKTDGVFNIIRDCSFNIDVPVIGTFNLILFKGHVIRIGKNENVYFDEDISFNVLKTVRGSIIQPIELNFLIIKNDYQVGNTVFVKQCASYDELGDCNNFNQGVVTSISQNKYNITVSFAQYKDPETGIPSPNVSKTFTQEELHLGEIEPPI